MAYVWAMFVIMEAVCGFLSCRNTKIKMVLIIGKWSFLSCLLFFRNISFMIASLLRMCVYINVHFFCKDSVLKCLANCHCFSMLHALPDDLFSRIDLIAAFCCNFMA